MNFHDHVDGALAIERLMRPRSVAIIGISSRSGTAGHTVLDNLIQNGFQGAIYLVGRSGGEISGRRVLVDISSLPEHVDLAILTMPASGVRDAVAQCVKRKVRAAVIFASGFSESGNENDQAEVTRIARAGGLALVGPNCVGYTNLVDGFVCGFANSAKQSLMQKGGDPAFAIISQSGGLTVHIKSSLEARNLQVSYMISSGNEADLGLADFIHYLLNEKNTDGIVIYAEHIRNPTAFLAAAQRAREIGKPIVLLHSGRSDRAKEATKSHTGALAGDYETMAVIVRRAGVVLVDTLEELTDVAEILARFPGGASVGGAAILTFSGAFCAMAHDYCEMIGLQLPSLSPEIEADLRPQLSHFISPRNPLDLGTQVLWQPELVEVGCKALLRDPAMGSLTIAISSGGPSHAVKYLDRIIAGTAGSTKPVVFAVFGDSSPLLPEVMALIKQHRVILSRSPERTLRAMGQLHRHGKLAATPKVQCSGHEENLPRVGKGTIPEYVGKKILVSLGIKVPEGDLAHSVDEAIAIATRVGWPVAMKAQASALAHKTDAGGVVLNVNDEASARHAWAKILSNVARSHPSLEIDGILVEKMSAKGLELVVGAKRDKHWGAVLLVGFGGVWAEAVGDVRLMAPDLSEVEIVKELYKLKSSKLFGKFRDMPERDVGAAARVVAALSNLMHAVPGAVEIEINPLVVHAKDEGATALDALLVTE